MDLFLKLYYNIKYHKIYNFEFKKLQYIIIIYIRKRISI